MVPNRDQENIGQKEFSEKETTKPKKALAEELIGKLKKDNRDDKLSHTQLDADKKKIDKARVLTEAINSNMSTFTPDLTFEQLVNNYSTAKKLMGTTLIRELTGYEPGYLEKNINIPEFKRELKERIKQNVEKLKKESLLEKDGNISEEGYEYAALSMLSEEIDNLEGKGLLGEKESKKMSAYGDRQDIRPHRIGDRYKDLEIKQSVKKAIRRGHTKISKEDLVSSERKAKGKLNIIYAVDSSGSMRGEKIKVAKKAGIALAYKAIKNRDNAGLIIFGSTISKEIEPGKNFYEIAKTLSVIKTSGETDIALCIEHAIKLFKSTKETNHLVLLTDALQTRGKKPTKEVLEKISVAANNKITISVVGINLDKRGEELSRKIVDISKGSLYQVKNLENIDAVILEDYYKTKRN